MAGRKPKPTHMKVLQGNPGKRPLPENEPLPEVALVKCPPHLKREARKEYNRLSKLLYDLRLLTEIDAGALAMCCIAWARNVEANRKLDDPSHPKVFRTANGGYARSPWYTIAEHSSKEYRAWCSEFGLTPSARTRISVAPEKKADEYEDYLNRGKRESRFGNR